jgi:hypothetical protein
MLHDFSKLFSLMLASVRGEMVVLPVDFPMEQERALTRGDLRHEKAIQFRHSQGSRSTDYLGADFGILTLLGSDF